MYCDYFIYLFFGYIQILIDNNVETNLNINKLLCYKPHH